MLSYPCCLCVSFSLPESDFYRPAAVFPICAHSRFFERFCSEGGQFFTSSFPPLLAKSLCTRCSVLYVIVYLDPFPRFPSTLGRLRTWIPPLPQSCAGTSKGSTSQTMMPYWKRSVISFLATLSPVLFYQPRPEVPIGSATACASILNRTPFLLWSTICSFSLHCTRV